MAKEKDTENAILAWLSFQQGCIAWKNQSVGIYDPIKKIYRRSNNPFHLKGVSDILGIWKGKPLAIEVKAGKNKPSPEQTEFLRRFILHGGIGIVAYSLKDVVDALKPIS